MTQFLIYQYKTLKPPKLWADLQHQVVSPKTFSWWIVCSGTYLLWFVETKIWWLFVIFCGKSPGQIAEKVPLRSWLLKWIGLGRWCSQICRADPSLPQKAMGCLIFGHTNCCISTSNAMWDLKVVWKLLRFARKSKQEEFLFLSERIWASKATGWNFSSNGHACWGAFTYTSCVSTQR